MPNTIWLLLVAAIIAIIGHYIPEGMIRMFFWVLALVVAIFAVVRLTGMG